MPGAAGKSMQSQLALAVARGVSVAVWRERGNKVPERTAYRWVDENRRLSRRTVRPGFVAPASACERPLTPGEGASTWAECNERRGKSVLLTFRIFAPRRFHNCLGFRISCFAAEGRAVFSKPRVFIAFPAMCLVTAEPKRKSKNRQDSGNFFRARADRTR